MTILSRLLSLRAVEPLVAYRDFRFLWVGNFFANNAQWLQLLTLGWLVRHLTTESSSSALWVITVGGLATLPTLVVGPWGGVLGDRLNRRKLIMVSQGFMAGFALIFAFQSLYTRVHVWQVYVYALVAGACLSIAQPTREALLANTVPRHALANAYATNVLTITGTRVITPIIGGLLITSMGAFFWNFTMESLLYLAMVLAFLPMNMPFYTPRIDSGTTSPVTDMKEGLIYMWKEEKVLVNLIILSLIPELILHPVWFLLPVFTEEVLHKGADVGGYLLTATGVGGLLSTLLIASLGFVFGRGIVCLGSAILSSIAVILFSQSQWVPAAIILIGLMAFAQSTFRTTYGSLVQTLAPDRLRGRLISLQGYGRSFVILPSLAFGWIAMTTSVKTTIAFMGVIGLIFAFVGLITLQRVKKVV